MKKKGKKITKNRKKFFIIAGCYIAVFIITCITTVATLAWFNGSTFSTNTIYLGGPVYLYFGDTNDKETSKENNLVLLTPPGWDYLYPGMSIQFQSRAIVQGAKFENIGENNQETIVYATGAVLRARMMIDILPPPNSNVDEETANKITQDIYRNLWAQIKIKAVTDVDARNEGVWVFDKDYNYTTKNDEEDHFFYYVKKNQSFENSGDYTLLDVGGSENNVSIGFLDKSVLTLSGKQLTNDHADCQIKFTIIYHALQAFFPVQQKEVGNPYPDLATNPTHPPVYIPRDVGTPKPLTIGNSREYFKESFDDIYDNNDQNIF